MTEVAFHSGVADKLGYTCRLLRKAWRAGNRVLVAGAPEQLARLDTLLWTFEPGEFIPHGRLRAGQPAPAALLARTPVWLVDEPQAAAAAGLAPCTVLVNLGPAPVPGHAGCARVIEVVADSDDEIAAGRQRWRAHVAAGLQPTNLAAGRAPAR